MNRERGLWIGLLAAGGAALQALEGFLPQPVPGVKPGIANVMTLLALYGWGPGAALEVAAIRSVLGGLALGTLLTPSFLLSLSGGLSAALVMGGLVRAGLADQTGDPGRSSFLLGIVGVSLAGASAHVVAQVGLVYALLVTHAGVFLVLPALLLSALATGLLTGLAARRALARLRYNVASSPFVGAGDPLGRVPRTRPGKEDA